MKFKVFLSLVLILLTASTALADQYHVYDAEDSLLIPKYVVQDKPDGSRFVYDPKHSLVVPKYVIKPIPSTNTYHLYDAERSLLIPEATVKGGEVK
jgi:hypothetical protein